MQYLRNAPFHVADIFSDIDDHYGFFETLYTNTSNEHAPLKKVRPEKPATMNKTWHKAVMNEARIKHVYDKYPSKTNWET